MRSIALMDAVMPDPSKSPAADPLSISPIGVIESPYAEKFGVPRQPGLVQAASGAVRMLAPFDQPGAFDGIDGFSHVWLTFGFHLCAGQWRARVRPPRLGGNQELGVFATRSPFRPNNLGLSVVSCFGIEQTDGELRLRVGGLDLVDGTPVYDIKPYVPYVDALPEAAAGFAPQAPCANWSVLFSEAAEQRLQASEQPEALRALIEQTLALDPRPAYRQGDQDERTYGMRLEQFDVRWKMRDGAIFVEALLVPE